MAAGTMDDDLAGTPVSGPSLTPPSPVPASLAFPEFDFEMDCVVEAPADARAESSRVDADVVLGG